MKSTMYTELLLQNIIVNVTKNVSSDLFLVKFVFVYLESHSLQESQDLQNKSLLFFFIRKGTFEIKLKICWAVELTGASMQISKQFLSYSIIAANYISAIRHVNQTIKNKHASLNGAPGLSRIIILVSDA